VIRFILYIIFLSCLHYTYAQQNLIPNGSFEEYTECPTGRDANNGQFERALGWYSPTLGTPDFINRCSNSIGTPEASEVSIPSNFFGYQEPFDGDGYTGFVAVAYINNGQEMEGTEYMQIQLSEQLKPCHLYEFSMRLSLADFSNISIKNVGVYFSEYFFEPSTGFLEKEAQLIFDEYIVDTSEWVLLKGFFVATNSNSHLTIGCFGNIIDTVSLYSTVFNDLGWLVAGIYVDSIAIFEISSIDSEICNNGDLIFPNIITPNNDGNNDYIDAINYFQFTDEIRVLNRWGNVVALLTANNPIWDGTSNGKKCPEGTYFYAFSYQWGTQQKEKSGFIQLVR
jgi:gliding motility-associated-like protein